MIVKKFSLLASLIALFFGLMSSILTKDFLNTLSLINYALFFLFMFFTYVNFRKEKKSAKSKQVQFNLKYVFSLLLLIALFVEVNYLSHRLNVKIDTTNEKAFSLDPETVKYVKTLDKDLTISVNQKANFSKERVYFLLEELKSLNPKKIHVDNYEASFDSKMSSQSTALLKLSGSSLKTAQVSEFNEVNFINSLVRLIEKKEKTALFINGIGEPNLRSTLPEGLSRFNNFLLDAGYSVLEVTEDADIGKADLLILAGLNLSDKFLLKLASYLESGGDILSFFNPRLKDSPNYMLNYFLKKYGIELDQRAVVLDKVKGRGQTWKILTNNVSKLRNFASLDKGKGVSFHLASPINILDSSKVKTIISSSKTSWGELDRESILSKTSSLDVNFERKGPMPLGVLYQDKAQAVNPSNLIVYGDIDWIRNSTVDLQDNSSLLKASLRHFYDWVPPIQVESTKSKPTFVLVTEKSYFRTILFCFLIPEIFLLLSLFFLNKRVSRYVA